MKKILLIFLKIFVILAILFVAGYFSFNFLMSAFVHEKSEVLVPDLQGKTLGECLDMLSQSKLALIKEGAEFNQNVPEGTVIRQIPPAGMNVKEGKIVKITISQGGEIVYVPDLKGQAIRSAVISLRALGLVLGQLTRKYSIKYEEGIVLEQDPIAGSTIEKDALINVVVSNGSPQNGTVLMPDWVGKLAKNAKKWAKDENYDVEVISKNTTLANPGEVFKQEPAFDAEITKETKIVFYVADKKSSFKFDEKIFEYIVPDGKENKKVRLVLNDENGDKDIFNGIKTPKSKIVVPVKVNGKATVKIFIDNISIEERNL